MVWKSSIYLRGRCYSLILILHIGIAQQKLSYFGESWGEFAFVLNRIKNAAPDSYTRRVELPQKGGATPGAQCYPSRAELTQERRVTSEGWSYLRTVVIPHRSELPQECGVTPGGRSYRRIATQRKLDQNRKY